MLNLDIFICYYEYRSIIKSFDDFFMKKGYARVELLGDKLTEIEPLINWEVFRPIIEIYMIIIQNLVAGQIMMKMLVLLVVCFIRS
jgi:hypothetical protein